MHCDICGSNKNIVAGRWIFYCPRHKQVDINKTFNNEIEPDIQSGNLFYLLDDEELSKIAEEILG